MALIETDTDFISTVCALGEPGEEAKPGELTNVALFPSIAPAEPM